MLIQNLNQSKEKIIEEFKVIFDDLEKGSLKGTEREIITKARVNQSSYRVRLLKRYSKCCLCGVTCTDFLIASHIKPWAESNEDERTDVNNGLLLCPNHDKLFDRGYISFKDNGEIILSNSLDKTDAIFMNVIENMKIKLPIESARYMKYHRENILK